MRVTILGSGTSVGVPVIGCECDVCRSEAPENKRLRSGIYVESDTTKILVDCSTDFRQQALRYDLRRIDAVLVTHGHADHINGIDDLRVFNFLQDGPIDIFAFSDTLETLRTRYDYCFNPTQIGGGIPKINLCEALPGKSFQIGDIEVLPLLLKHGKLDVMGLRIGKDFAYLTDCNAVPDSSVEMLKGVKILVVDALRPTSHATHFSLSEALEFSKRLEPEQTWFTHMTCRLEHFATNASLPPEAQLLYDGQVIEIESDKP